MIFNPRPARAAFDADEPFERAVARWDAVSDLREQIRELLSEDEWAAARRNTINAHYTDADLVRSIWGAVRGLGFTGGRVLEPGSGSGNFIGFAPILTSTPVQMTGVEVEPTTAAIARRLYPDAEIITSGLEEIPLADGGFDGVVGNVPFGRYKRYDKVHNADLSLSIHDHFVLKALYATRPGGIVALITSRYTLDAEKPDARMRMYQLGDLVGAVRLPARAHAAAAGTDVVTDVLFLRRRMPGEEPGDKTWLTSRKRVLPGHEDELAVNAYFDAHPEYVLGELRAGSREWGPEVTVVGRTDQAPAESLAAAAAAIAVEARAAGLTAAADQRTEPVQTLVTGGTEGALGLDAEGNPTIIDGGRPVPLEIHPSQREQLVRLIRLKHLTLALYEAEADTPEPGETPQLAALRAELRVAWRDYRKNHPPLTKPRQHYIFTPPEAREQATAQGLKDVPAAWKQRTAFAWIDDDPDASLLFGLEEWDERTGKGTEQKVLLTRVLEPRTLPARANSHEDAIALAMEYDGGRLDMNRVADLLGLDEESAAAQCADAGLAYRDPLQDDAWEPRHRYLSGNVRAKLTAARERAAEDPTFLGNVSALERVQPADLTPSEIKAKIGAPWLPVDVYNDFLAHLGFEDASVLHAGGTVWEVRGAKNGDLARTEWGTSSRPTQDLFTALLRQADSTIQVTYRDDKGHTYVDKAATDEAQEKARLIAEAFEDWVWADETRAANLAKIYNEQFNNLVLPEYSGSALTLPGLISDWEMRPHQNAAIRRIVNEPTALLAHVVGAGKTATMAAGAMELRRTGLATKPCLIVPNHMLKQWSREFRQLYPNAKILAITASDLNKKRRAKFMGRIAGGDWDAVILTHEAFNRVPLRAETQRNYLDREMRSLRDQLDTAAAAGMHRNTVKQIEESLANAEAKLQQQIESMGDDNGVFLEDTGVDYVFLDEAHEYKNLRTVSAIPGAAIQGSAKATKLHMVLDYLRATNETERVATLATGTPIANSVTEAYVLKRYLAPQLLEDMGLDAFDNWAATFGEVVSQLEPDPKGDGYKYKARFSRFFNVPELMSAYRVFADVQMAEDLDLPTPPVRENEDGQRGETVLIPPTSAQRQFIKELPHKPWVRKPGGVLKALGEGLRASVDLDLVDATEALRNLGLNVTADQVMSDDPAGDGRVLDMAKVADLADAAAVDMRSVGGSKEMGSKIPYAAEKIAEIWQETKDIVYPVSVDDPTPQELPGGLQLVFLDEGTPGSTAKHAADLYADLRDELVAKGMPRESIRFIHEASTDKKKEKLFADCRSGRVSVLIGSTQKMGTGTNIQDRAVALHHLSYPWRPADMAQRDGRIERRGNLNAPWIENTPNDVRIIYYITERTFDEFRLTTLARKARFIGQIQRKDFSAREIEDIGADAINLGMLSALASGDPAILQLAEATAERARLQGLARSWDRQQDTRSQELADIDDFLARADVALEGMRAAAPNRRPTTGDHFGMTVGDATYRSRDAAANALGAQMAAIAGDQSIRPGDRIPIGTFGGQDFHAEIAYGASGRRQLRLRFAWGHVVPPGQREDRAQWQASSVTQSNGRGAIQSLEHFLNHLDDNLTKLEQSAEALRDRREEIAANLRPKDENPYRIQARSKEREEKALGKLVVANEKEAALAERVERAASIKQDSAEEVDEELQALREHIAKLRQIVSDEHAVQARARGLTQNETDADPGAQTAEGETPDEPEAATSTVPDGSGSAEPPAAATEQQDDTPPAEPKDQPGPEPSGSTAEPDAPEPEAEPSPEPVTHELSGDAVPSVQDLAVEPPPVSQETPAPAPADAAPGETAPLPDVNGVLGDRVSVAHIGGPQNQAEPAAEASAGEPESPAGDDAQPAPPAAAEPENPPADTGLPQGEPEDADADDTESGPEAEDMVTVQTPDGPGTVIGTDDGDLVLVTTQSGTRVWESSEIQWPDDVARPENADRVAKERQSAADAAQAATSEGIELRYTNGNRLVDLDTEAGHGTVVDADGAVIGWVRARIGDDGRRYWWAQDARGGAPDDMPFHESLPPSAGVPAIRAASSIRSELHAFGEPAHRSPRPAEYAAREVRLTTAQVRELRRLVLDATYSDGTPIEPPEWVASHRKYVLNTAQMQALGDAARAAADAFPGVTAEERRTARVLRNAAERFEYEVYDTARWRATIPPPGETDPYAGPYQPRPQPELPDAQQETADVPAPAPQPEETETQASVAGEMQPAAPADTETPAPAGAPETAPADPQDDGRAGSAPETPVVGTPAPDPALTAAAAPGPTDADAEDTGAEDEDAQLDLFPSETPEAPAPARRPGGRRGTSRGEPAIHPRAEGGPEDGRLGVYGHAGHGECDRCGTADTDRYTMVWAWHSGTEDGGAMAAECGSCVELTTGLSHQEYRRLADVAEARRGGRRIVPTPYAKGDVTGSRTAENEWTYVHRPTGKRYRLAEETPSGYRGFVLRDLYGISQGTGVSTSSGYELAERAALGRTAETHPNSSDDWVFFGYRSDVGKLALHEGESINTSHPSGPRSSGAPFEHGPRWNITVSGTDFQVEMVYQQGPPGEDGHRLEITAPDGTSARYVQWDGVLEWARERVRAPEPDRAAAPLAAPLAEAEEALTAAEDIRNGLQDRSATRALVHVREAWDRARYWYEADRLAEGDGHLATARSDAILARFRESNHADFQPLMAAVRRFHDAADEILYPGGAGWRPAVGDYVRARHQYVPESEGFWMKVTAIGPDGIHVQSGMTGESKTVVQPTDLGPHADLTWQGQPFRAPGEPRATAQERRAHLGMPPQTAPEPGLPVPAQTQSAPADPGEEQLDLFAAASPEAAATPQAPAPPATPKEAAVPGTEPPRGGGLGLVDGESLTYRGDWDGRYEITLPGTSYLLFMPSVEYRRTKFAVASNDEPDVMSPKRLRRFEEAEEIMPWVRAHASRQQTGHLFRDGAWTQAPQTVAPQPPADGAAAEDGQLLLLGADGTAPASADEKAAPEPAPAVPPAAAEQSATRPAAEETSIRGPQNDAPTTSTHSSDAAPEEPDMATPARPATPEAADRTAPEGPAEAMPAEPGDDMDVEDPPEPQRYTETTVFPTDPAYQLALSGMDGQSPDAGQVLYDGAVVATLHRSTGGWSARLAIDALPADVTPLRDAPQSAAHEGAILFASRSGASYGQQPTAVANGVPEERAAVLRAELRDTARQHLEWVARAAVQVWPDYQLQPQHAALAAQLARMSDASADSLSARQMTNRLASVREAAQSWRDRLPSDPAAAERQLMAYPLAHLLYDVERLNTRLQATSAAVQAERAAASRQSAPAPAAAAPMEADAVAADKQPPAGPTPAVHDTGSRPPEAAEDDTRGAPDLPAAAPEADHADHLPPARSAQAPQTPAATEGETSLQQGDAHIAEAAEPTAPIPSEDLPLWTGPDGPPSQPDNQPVDLVTDFAAVQQAWDATVPAGHGTGEDLFAEVQAEILQLQQMLADAVTNNRPAAGAPGTEPSSSGPETPLKNVNVQQTARAVNTALRQADAHATALQDLPEWQRVQTIRGAFGNLMRVMKDRAGEHFASLMSDNRVADFVRRISIRTCEKIAGWAQSAADRLRQGGPQRQDLPSADALRRLGDAALEYTGRRATPPPPANAAPGGALDIPAMRKMGEALNRPMPGATKGVSAAAARGRSTTAKRAPGKPANGTEQAGHLRRGGSEQQHTRKPQR
ncbi:DEAD/DEAH box helicase family protein [Streptomyces sp. NPDC016309]|uniref:DEAD/DEAH box helicase family protein n=1 Tax=Streptomyces sp. NPDC016309 TaxID=3364965 RepID=UPI00370039FF